MKCTKIGLIGFGTVGTGVARLLLEQQERISKRCGQDVRLKRIADIRWTPERNVAVPEGVLTDDYRQILDDPEISIVVQLVGGTEIERTMILEMLRAGKNIVTANKALLAAHGNEIFKTARENGCTVAFEAAVGGGIPIIAGISESLAANEIQSIQAILNGTCNFILSRMEKEGSDYASALAEAQRLGFAELNPDLDVQGKDATQKIAILSQLAFGAQADWTKISREGITSVAGEDFRYAKHLGYTIRLIAEARRAEGQELEVCVSPAWVKCGTMLAGVDGAFNAVSVVGDAVGHVFFYGQGAGQMPTASAVVADIIDTVVGRTAITFNVQHLWDETTPSSLTLREPEDIHSAFYLRFSPINAESGSKILEILSELGIVPAEVLPAQETGTETVALITQEIPAKKLTFALETLAQYDILRHAPVKMRFLK